LTDRLTCVHGEADPRQFQVRRPECLRRSDFGNRWQCLAMSGMIWLCLALSGFVWLCPALSGSLLGFHLALVWLSFDFCAPIVYCLPLSPPPFGSLWLPLAASLTNPAKLWQFPNVAKLLALSRSHESSACLSCRRCWTSEKGEKGEKGAEGRA
jgi:hypothetical protein